MPHGQSDNNPLLLDFCDSTAPDITFVNFSTNLGCLIYLVLVELLKGPFNSIVSNVIIEFYLIVVFLIYCQPNIFVCMAFIFKQTAKPCIHLKQL